MVTGEKYATVIGWALCSNEWCLFTRFGKIEVEQERDVLWRNSAGKRSYKLRRRFQLQHGQHSAKADEETQSVGQFQNFARHGTRVQVVHTGAGKQPTTHSEHLQIRFFSTLLLKFAWNNVPISFFADVTFSECGNNANVVEMLRNEALTFAVNKNLLVHVRIIDSKPRTFGAHICGLIKFGFSELLHKQNGLVLHDGGTRGGRTRRSSVPYRIYGKRDTCA